MRALSFLLIMFALQSPTPAPLKQQHADQDKVKTKQQENRTDDKSVQDLVTAVNALTAEIAARNQQQANSLHNGSPPSDAWTKVNVISIPVFTLALVVLAYCQWRAMKKQAEYMRDALAETIKAANAAKTSAEAASKQATVAEAQIGREAVRDRDEERRYAEQLDLANKNAAIAKQNANAALLNAKAVMNAERPWVLIENMTLSVFVPLEEINPNATQHDLYTLCQFRNYGNTPAKIIGQDMEMQFGTDTGRPPDFAILVKARPVTPYYIPPKENVPALAVSPAEQRGPFTRMEIVRIKKESLVPWVCGFVRYADVFGRTFKVTFCYRCIWPEWSRTPIFSIAGPDEYNSHIEE